MLEPNEADSWASFLDTLRPPPGYDLEAGIGTTYGLSMEVLTAALLGFVNVEGAPPGDLTTTLLALMRVAERLRVFVHRGFDLDVAKGVPEVYGLLDRIVRDVSLPETPDRRPSFHPKLWALSFLRRSRPELRQQPERVFRVLCASRNLTKSRCWELGLRLDGVDASVAARRDEDPVASPIGADVATFIELLLGHREEPPHFHALAKGLRAASFRTGGDLKTLRLHAGWPGGEPLFDQLPKQGKRALVVSAFVRSDFLDELAARFNELTIVSKQDQFDALPRPLDPRVEAATKYVVTTESSVDSDFKIEGLHAKVVICEGTKRERVTFHGSANATRAGWGRSNARPSDRAKQNCEVVISARPGLPLDAFSEAFVRDANGNLRPWVIEYRQQPVVETDEERDREKLRDWLTKLAGIDLVQRYDKVAKQLILSARHSEAVALPEPNVVGAVAQLAPMLLQTRHDGFRPYTDAAGVEGGARYEDVPLASISDFVLLRARSPLVPEVVCVVIAPVTGVSREERDIELNKKLLANADPNRLLEAILFGAERRANRDSPGGSNGGDREDPQRSTGAWVEGLTLERLLEACVERPSVASEIETWLSWCPADKEPKAFLALWESFRRAGISSPGGRHRGR